MCYSFFESRIFRIFIAHMNRIIIPRYASESLYVSICNSLPITLRHADFEAVNLSNPFTSFFILLPPLIYDIFRKTPRKMRGPRICRASGPSCSLILLALQTFSAGTPMYNMPGSASAFSDE